MAEGVQSRLWLLVVGLLVAGCVPPSSESTGEWAGSVDTLSSGRVVVTNPDQPMSPEALVLREAMRLGSLGAEGPELFGRIDGLALGPEGDVYVLDGQASEVRAFNQDGTFRVGFGGEGGGPGELDGAAGLALDPDGVLWVMNWGNARYSGFDPRTGEVHEEVRRSIDFAQFPWPGTFDDEGRLLDIGLDADGEVAALRLNAEFQPFDTLQLPRLSDDDRIFFRRESMLVAAMPEPFAPSPTWAPRPRGGIVIGEGSSYRLHRVAFGGDTLATIELARVPVQVTGPEADSALASFLAIQESLGGATPSRRPSVRDTKPAHGPLFIDDQDRTWVTSSPNQGAPPSWDVFDAEGRLVGRVEIPDPPTPVRPVVRSTRLALATQVNGYPEVVVYEITRHRQH